jgi:hypothetical protein
MRFEWPGVMVLLAHLLDIVEWGVILIAPTYFGRHWVSNSLWSTSVVAAVVCAALAVFVRLRRPWPYLLAIGAIFSHVGLDHPLWRAVLVDLYGDAPTDELVGLGRSVLVEVWFYGLLLVGVLVVRACTVRGCPRRGRVAAGLLAAAAILAAVSRNPWLWIPAYCLTVLHVLLLLRSTLNWRLVWGVLPVIPLFALLAVEVWAGWLYQQGESLKGSGDPAAAIVMFERSIAVPTRSPKTGAYVQVSHCWRSLGEFAAAETALLQAESLNEGRYWARYQLAWFYLDNRLKGTRFDRPDLSAERLRQVIDGDAPANIKAYARRFLADLRKQGRIE